MANPRPSAGVKPRKRGAARLVRAALLVLLLALLWPGLAFEPYRIPSRSMEETLLPGDFLLVDRVRFGLLIPFGHGAHLPALRRPRAGDIVVFEHPAHPGEDYVKRCVAVEGDTVLCTGGVVYRNGAQLDEPYTKRGETGEAPAGQAADQAADPARDVLGPLVVPAGHVLVLGDNRGYSSDSRRFGPLDVRLIRGKVVLVYFSWDPQRERVRLSRLLRAPA
jgi:signal peptidase I